VITTLPVAAFPLALAGLRALLEGAPDCTIVGQATSLRQAATLIGRLSPDVTIIDLAAGRADDLSDLVALAQERSDVGLVLLVEAGAEPYLPEPSRGRIAYLPRDASAEAVLSAVRGVAAGLVILDPRVVPALVAPVPRLAAAPPAEPLTAREREVLALLAQGLPNKTIAHRLAISEHTAKFHVGAILAKLGAASRTEAVTLAARQGLLML
jgi:DNA-binding NarL/FixJ family response regulator